MRNIVKVLLFILLFTMLLTPVFAENYITLASTDVSVFEGKTYQLVPHHTEKGASFTYVSDNTSVAPVDSNGLVRALSPGTASITITEDLHGTSAVVSVTVKNKGFVYAVYVPPTEGYATGEQYDYLAEAGINTVIMHGYVKRAHMDASLAAGVPRGIQFYVSDERLAGDIFSYSEATIRDYIRSYKDKEGVYGYYLKDEPIYANDYAVPYRIMASEDPDAIVHLNFYPMGTVEQFGTTYDGYVDDWVSLVGPEFKRTISYDNYPFNNDIYNEQVCMAHFEHFNKYARKHDVDFEYFVQSCSLNGGFFSNDNSVRYHFSIGLAYGAKSFQYFTWFTPLPTNEAFVKDSAIMTSDGKKGPLFEITKKTNENARKVEPYLAPTEAIEVYHTGSAVQCETILPSNYFFKVASNARAIVTLYHNEAQNEYYILVVNKNYTEAAHTFDFTIEGATEVYDLTGGSPVSVSLTDSKFSSIIEGGYYRLYSFNKGFIPKLAAKKESDNLALNKPVYVHTSVGKNGFYAMNLTDGDPKTSWSATQSDNKLYALIDLKKVQPISYLTLQTDADYQGTAKISVSKDNYIFTTIAESFPLTASSEELFFKKQEARYVKIEIPNTSVHLAECQVYSRAPIRLRYQNTHLEKGMTYLRTTGDFEDIQVISALYENGIMTDVHVLTPDEIEKGDTPLFQVTDLKNTVVKTFLLQNGIRSLTPYQNPFVVTESNYSIVYEDFEGDYDSEFWARTVGDKFSASGKLTGFAYAVGTASPVFVKAGYSFGVDIAAPYAADKNYWMSAPVTLRGVRTAASFNQADGIMLLFQEDRVALRTKADAAWNIMMQEGQKFLPLPVSLKTPQRIIFEDNGEELITISYVDAQKGVVPFAYIVIDATGATLYNADQSQSFGTCPASMFGDGYISVCSHLDNASFDNFELTYNDKVTVTEGFDGGIFDTNFWVKTFNGNMNCANNDLRGFALSFGTQNAIDIHKGYTLSLDLTAPYDATDKSPWMSAGIALRASQNAAPYYNSAGLLLFIQDNKIGLRTKNNAANWIDFGVSMMTVPVSFSTTRKLVLRDNGYDEIRIMAENDNGELIDLGYIFMDTHGATLYNADKSKAYGTAPASLYAGGSHVGVFQHLSVAIFDNISLTYAE